MKHFNACQQFPQSNLSFQFDTFNIIIFYSTLYIFYSMVYIYIARKSPSNACSMCLFLGVVQVFSALLASLPSCRGTVKFDIIYEIVRRRHYKYQNITRIIYILEMLNFRIKGRKSNVWYPISIWVFVSFNRVLFHKLFNLMKYFLLIFHLYVPLKVITFTYVSGLEMVTVEQ